PLRIQLADDPLVAFLRRRTPDSEFIARIGAAVSANPSVEETRFLVEEAEAARREARSALFPTLDLALSSRTSLARDFSDDPDNIVERSRARGRTDATFVVNQRLLDFGTASMRVDAAGYRLRAAMFERERQSDSIALRAIATWYDVFTYRALVEVGEARLASQFELRDAIETRIAEGVSARGDIARIDSELASSAAQLAGFERQLANAEARYTELFEQPAPEPIARAPLVAEPYATREAVEAAALGIPAVQLTQAQAYAARQDARASRAETLPSVNGRIEGGRFGIFENDNDYDIRASIVLEQRFFGGGDARADQAEARAGQSRARADAVREEALRLASIAWSDVEALETQLAAVEASYLSSRQSRDVIFERFRLVRGTLFDVLAAQRDFYDIAVLYIQTVT
ncbi:MAG: TolC family protein, partial [Sphingomonadales bacterium]|nr:TolC family protein [Sphingomonadales bacterium]